MNDPEGILCQTKMRNWRRIWTLLKHATPFFLLLFFGSTASATTGWKKSSFSTATGTQCIDGGWDLNNDGYPDIVVSSMTERAVVVHYSNGPGKFTVASKFATNNYPDCLRIFGNPADNARLVAVIGHSPNTLTVFVADDSGNLHLLSTTPLAFAPVDFVVGDFNNDMTFDFAVVGGTNQVQLLMGQGGSYSSQLITVPGAQHLISIADGLFHNQPTSGETDLAVLSCCGDGNKLTLFTLLNDFAKFTVKPGSLTFTGYNQGRLQDDKTFADVNGDYLDDLALITSNNQGDFSYTTGNLLLNNGDGSFRLSHSYPLPNPARTFSNKPLLIDLDGDQIPDFVISGEQQYQSGSAGDSDVWVWYLKKDGSVKSSQKITLHTSGFSPRISWQYPVPYRPRPDLLALSTEAGSATDKVYYLQNTPYCQAPTSPGINICSPAPGSSYWTYDWVEVLASGYVGGAKAKYMEAWMDGKKLTSTNGSTVYWAMGGLAVGTHKVTIFATNGAGTKISKVVYFTTKEITP